MFPSILCLFLHWSGVKVYSQTGWGGHGWICLCICIYLPDYVLRSAPNPAKSSRCWHDLAPPIACFPFQLLLLPPTASVHHPPTDDGWHAVVIRYGRRLGNFWYTIQQDSVVWYLLFFEWQQRSHLKHPGADWPWLHLGNARWAGRVEVKKRSFLHGKRWFRNFLMILPGLGR